MMRVERLVVPAAKSCCSTSSVRRPARAHSRAIATPLIPPPITITWKRSPSKDGRVFTSVIASALMGSSRDKLTLVSLAFVFVKKDNAVINKITFVAAHDTRRCRSAKHLPPRRRVIYSDCAAMPTTGERFERAVSIMARLRGPGGCPWDREQTFDTIKPYTLDEAYEVVEAIDARDWDELTGELGDLLLQVLFYSEMAAEEKRFSIDDVLDRLSNKLVDRHPHVFGEVKADTPGDVLRNWQALKAEEKKKRQQESGATEKKEDHPESVLAGVSTAMPSLMEAYKISSRVANVGFDWPNIEGLFEKLIEDTGELRRNLDEYPEPGPQPESKTAVAGARGVKISPELRARLEDEV